MKLELVNSSSKTNIELIANAYLAQWKIPFTDTVSKIKNLSEEPTEFQLILRENKELIATAGLYKHVTIVDYIPRLSKYKHWLALVYTAPELRLQGYGSLICKKVEESAKQRGISDLALFTDTKENFYQKLGWSVSERIELKGKNITIMSKVL